jgi:hypothetical protein
MDNVEFQTLFNIAISALWFILGFTVNRLFNSLDRLQKQDKELSDEIHEIRVSLPTNYVTKDDLGHATTTIFKKLDKLSDQLNHLVLKTNSDR